MARCTFSLIGVLVATLASIAAAKVKDTTITNKASRKAFESG